MLKRIFDIAVSMVGLIILSPLLLLISLYIVLESNGPVFFQQIRVGKGGSLFKVKKFRTMVVNAEELGHKITVDGDPRITKSGLFLRKHKLDELPQLLNVLVGEMSFVGPRPEVPEYVDYYSDDERDKILSVRPGITDKASIEFKNENSMLENSKNPLETYRHDILPIKIRYYLEYVDSNSLGGDIKLLFKTVFAIVK